MTLERNTNPVRSEPLQPAGSTTATALVASPGGPSRKKDEPMNSRNSPATLNVLTSSAEFKEDFFNRYERYTDVSAIVRSHIMSVSVKSSIRL